MATGRSTWQQFCPRVPLVIEMATQNCLSIANLKIPYFKFHSCTEQKKKKVFFFPGESLAFLRTWLLLSAATATYSSLYHVKGEVVQRKSMLSTQRGRPWVLRAQQAHLSPSPFVPACPRSADPPPDPQVCISSARQCPSQPPQRVFRLRTHCAS